MKKTKKETNLTPDGGNSPGEQEPTDLQSAEVLGEFDGVLSPGADPEWPGAAAAVEGRGRDEVHECADPVSQHRQ